MKLLIGFILAPALAVLLGLQLKKDPGYVLISIGNWTLETSVFVFAILTLLLFMAGYLVVRYTFRLLHLRRDFHRMGSRRRHRKGQQLLTKGIQSLAEGRWATAEAAFARGAPLSETPVVHYLGAARAAQRLEATDRRDAYLEKAAELRGRDAALVAGLSRAELLLEAHQPDAAMQVLEPLHGRHPRQPRVLDMLAQCYRATGEWEKLRVVYPELKKRHAIPETRLHQLQRETWQGLLTQAAARDGLEGLKTLWKQVPRHLRDDEAVVITQAGLLRDHDDADGAAHLIRDALKKQWSDVLVVGFGQLERGHVKGQLATAEGWLKSHPDNPHLLLTAGRLAQRAGELAKARDYLERSIARMPTPDGYEALGEVLIEAKDEAGANRCFRTGLRLLSGKPEVRQADEVLPALEKDDAVA